MNTTTLILGGARSGKSSYAAVLSNQYKKVAFIATAEALDKEMKKRIETHKKNRPAHWTTFEESRNILSAISKIKSNFNCIVIDCLTLWVSNLMGDGLKQNTITKSITKILNYAKEKNIDMILVSNEVGLGIVPAVKLGRDFRDIAGTVNRIAAKRAHHVYFLVSGIPLKIK